LPRTPRLFPVPGGAERGLVRRGLQALTGLRGAGCASEHGAAWLGFFLCFRIFQTLGYSSNSSFANAA
jgi:hypothetical protein